MQRNIGSVPFFAAKTSQNVENSVKGIIQSIQSNTKIDHIICMLFSKYGINNEARYYETGICKTISTHQISKVPIII